ncbi:MAG: hypothetical protein A3K19_27070 [Lentisphaerae bacterium RIFOXYB12_FULL_65_16]|nr:MAG: hypothetical protein A3K18_24445 [Lentisphaerae bacterium RIFOXYA12_64_32]OGV90250.1 MAG: hypothetical protein A3K19_27070 [Lentisphaerae bacterium RIFOXYB12_FULL_65_16]
MVEWSGTDTSGKSNLSDKPADMGCGMARMREQVECAAAALRAALPAWQTPVGVVQLGTGFDPAGLLDEELGSFSFSDIPGMPPGPSPAGHPLRGVLGRCGEVQILLLNGHRHVFEGYGIAPCVLPVCAAVACGVRNVILLVTGGGVHEEFRPGTWVAATDYVNNQYTSPLVGNLDLGGEECLDMTQAFSQPLLSEVVNAASEVGVTVRMGTYQADVGPQLQTPLEVEIARQHGADALGMNGVQETIAACAMGARTAALILVNYLAAHHAGKPPSFAQIAEVSAFASPPMMRALRLALQQLPTG